MALKTFIGARYTPKFMGAWNKSSQYAALSVVYTNNTSYVSRQTVPADTEITNTEYWIKSADWNAQVDEYHRQTEEYNTNVVQYNQNVQAYDHDVNEFFNVTMHSYPTKADMVADQTIKEGYTLLTCGDTEVGDGKGEYYKVATKTSATAVALENGLFAVPFTMKEYQHNFFGGTITSTLMQSSGGGTGSESSPFNIIYELPKMPYPAYWYMPNCTWTPPASLTPIAITRFYVSFGAIRISASDDAPYTIYGNLTINNTLKNNLIMVLKVPTIDGDVQVEIPNGSNATVKFAAIRLGKLYSNRYFFKPVVQPSE